MHHVSLIDVRSSSVKTIDMLLDHVASRTCSKVMLKLGAVPAWATLDQCHEVLCAVSYTKPTHVQDSLMPTRRPDQPSQRSQR